MKCQGQEEPSLRFSLFLFLFPFKFFAPWKCHFSLGVSAWHNTYRWSRDCPVAGPDGVSEGRFCAQPTESKVDSIAIVWIGIVTFRHWKRIGENERDSLFCYPSVRFLSCGAKCQTGVPTDSPIGISNNWSRNVLIWLNKTLGGMIDILGFWYGISGSTVRSLAARNPKAFKFTHSSCLAILLDFAATNDNTLTGWSYCEWYSIQAHPGANAVQQSSALTQT